MKKYLLPLILILLLTFTLVGYCVSYTSQYPPAFSGTYVKATTERPADYWPYLTTDPSEPLIGTITGNQWMSGWDFDTSTNQRFHIDLGSAKIIRRIYYENSHNVGSGIDRGVQNFTFWGSNTGAGTFDDLVWGNDGGWTELTVAQNTFDEHSEADEADPKYIIVTNLIAYRYYAFKFADNYGASMEMGVRRIELQTEDGYTPPNIATLSDPTQDGFITYNGETYTKDAGLDYFYAGFVSPNIYRGYVEWDVSSIPEGVIITDTVFKYHGQYNSRDCHIHECVGQRPSTADYEALYNEIGGGTVYAEPDGFPIVGINQQVDLGTSADSDLESQLSVGWFAIGVQSDSEAEPLGFSRIYCEDFPGTPNPTLYVEYKEAPEVNVIFFSTPY